MSNSQEFSAVPYTYHIMATSIQGDHSKKLSTVQFIAEMCIACAKYRGEYLPDTWDTFISAVAAKSPEFGPYAKVVFASKCTALKRVPILGTGSL